MGATVLLFNRYERLVQRSLTNETGLFVFDSLLPDLYSLRVSLASFVPALKQNITIQPGMRSFLAIHLASVLSSIELVYSAAGPRAIMSEDWKWALRSAPASRPVLRILPGIDISDPSTRTRTGQPVFSNTRGLLNVSAGEGGVFSAGGNQPDLGTAFALATSLFGANHLEFSGNVGYASASGIPTAGFRTSYSRDTGGGPGPQVNLTMRQIFLPSRVGSGFAVSEAPPLRTMSVSMVDRRQLTDDLRFTYGSSLESVSFLDRLNYLSPFARLDYDLGGVGTFRMAFSSGSPAAELLASGDEMEPGLQEQLAVLSLFPRVSLLGGRARVQRSENFEIGYRRVDGSRTYSAAVFREGLSNTALTIAAPGGFYPAADLLPDLASSSSVFNAGRFRRLGYTAAFTQALGEDLNFTLSYGYGDALVAGRGGLRTSHPDELRGLLRMSRRHWLMARVGGSVPRVGTRFAAGYQWTDYSALSSPHLFLTQTVSVEPGMNLHLRQPVPVRGVFHGRLEAIAELRNLLAQGYLPLATSDGRRVVLIHSPRAVRGGLSFIF